LAADYFHSTAREAALVAKRSEANKLVLTHISARYQSEDILLAEAREVHPHTVIAHDLESVST